jgi:hypothetical protein
LQIDKLIRAGADILAPIAVGPKRVQGTAVDYAYQMYNADRRIAHMPYHALSHAERETFNARRKLLAHLGDILRMKAVERERERLEEDDAAGRCSESPLLSPWVIPSICLHAGRSPSAHFVYTGAGMSKRGVSFGGMPASRSCQQHQGGEEGVRKPLLRYCYECGRSVGVRLSACTRCKEVFYCSKACKLKAWNARHKDECVRIAGRSPSPAKDKRVDSPTPTTDPDKGKATTVQGIGKEQRLKVI